MKNRVLAVLIFSFVLVFFNQARAQQSFSEKSSVSFNKSDLVLVFDLKTTLPDSASYQSLGRVFITGNEEGNRESRVHRVVADRSSGVYFGYDLVVKSDDRGKFVVSVQPLSRPLTEYNAQFRGQGTQLFENLTAQTLPKYPADLTVEEGDTIELDILYNPQTKVRIVDLIKIATKKPLPSDASLLTRTANSSETGSESGAALGSGGLLDKENVRDFSLSDVKLRLTSPKLLAGGVLSPLSGSQWEGMIEGSIIRIYIPGNGRFSFSLFPPSGSKSHKGAIVEDSRIVFESGGERYEIVSAAPIVSAGGGSWNLWTLHDANYRPDLIFSPEAAGYIEYGAGDEGRNLEMRKSRLRPVPAPREKARIYEKWLDEVRYIVSDNEKKTFSRLTSNSERELFIESFWQRRDPKPETKDNEFRREYYSRIAYANENYGFGETLGRLTDRGRIFIMHGKPDETQKGTSGETWIYRSLPGLGDNIKFEFSDVEKNGNFRLRP